jgi:serine/threonine-protein kinase RsbW
VTVRHPVEMTIASDASAVRAVQERILSEIERHGFDSQSHFAVKLALEEALINAAKHGNKWDPAKKVHVIYAVTDKQCEVMIEDEGPGFDRSSVPDPTLEENIEKCSGRGILLMEAYMNSVRWSHGGRRVRLVKLNESEAV